MYINLLIVSAFLTLQPDAKLPDGVYTMCEEVAGYSSETIELKNGKFRYWFRSDFNAGNEPEYPLDGAYRVSGNTLILENDKIHSPKRTIAVVNGVDVLWRKDGLDLWEKEKRVHPYAVLIRVSKETDGSKVNALPSVRSLYSKEMLAREKKEYEERYNDQPAEIRVLLRARSLAGDSDMAVYKREILRAREKLDPVLVRQLIAGLNDRSTRIDANFILADLYSSTWLIKDEPPFTKNRESKKKALGHLIDGLTASRDRHAVEDTLLLFLKVSDVGEIDLSIAEAGVRIKLKMLPNGGYSASSGAINIRSQLPKTWQWTDEIKLVVPAVQNWMREQLAK